MCARKGWQYLIMEWQQKDEMEYNAIYNDYIKCIVTQELYDENGKDKELWYAHIEINWKYCKEVYSFEDYNYNNDKRSN